MRVSFIPLVLAMGVWTGCEDSASNNAPATPATPPASASAQKNSPPPPPPPPSAPTPAQEVAKSSTSPVTTPAKPAAETPPPGMIAEKADVGSGDKGRGYGEGIVATPVATYFAARERIMFTIQIPKLLEAYKFEHDMKGPKSHEEFMKEVIKKYGIELPTLPPGHKYWYDAKDGELKVLRPN
jgi:hypothetical protein